MRSLAYNPFPAHWHCHDHHRNITKQPNPARYDPAAKRFRGYAWAEYVAWINLDQALSPQFVPTEPIKDCNGDVDGVDFSVFASCFNNAGNPPRTPCLVPWLSACRPVLNPHIPRPPGGFTGAAGRRAVRDFH